MAYKPIDLMHPNPAQPVDLQSQQAALAQQAAIANALIAQSMERSSPIIHTGGGNQFARDVPNIGDPVARVVQAMMGRKQQDEVNRGQNDLNLETQRRSQKEISDVLGARFGVTQPGGMDDEGGQMPGVQQKPNYIRAMQIASQATTPAGKAMMAELLKGTISPEEAFKQAQHLDIPSVAKTLETQDIGNLKPKIELKQEGGAVRGFRPGEGPVGPAAAIDTFGKPTVNEVGVPVQTSDVTGKQTSFGQFGNTTPAAKLEEALGAGAVKILDEGRKAYAEDTNRLAQIGQLRTDMAALPAEKFGALAGFRNTLNKLTEVLGAKPMDATANMESVQTETGKLLLEKIRLLAPVTDQDVKIVKDIVGSEGLTKRGLEKVLDQLEKATTREMARHTDFVKNFNLPPNMNREQFTQMYVPAFSTQAVPPIATPAASSTGWKIERQ